MSYVAEVLFWIDHHSWVLFAYYSLGLFTASGVMAIHIVAHPRLPRYMWMLSIGAALGAAGCLLAGMQAGDDPLFPAHVVIPWTRLAWTVGITLLLIVCMMYIFKAHPKTY